MDCFIDLEFDGNTIIEIGAYVPSVNASFVSYVHTDKVLSKNVRKLTGITTKQLVEAPCFESVLENFSTFLAENKVSQIFSWSLCDRGILFKECESHGCSGEAFENLLWKDAQALYSEAVYYDRLKILPSLENALKSLDLETSGRRHDALFDAIDTARLYETICAYSTSAEVKKKIDIIRWLMPKEGVFYSLGDVLSKAFATVEFNPI